MNLLFLLLILFFLSCYALFAGMETGIISMRRLRLRHMVAKRMPGAEFIQELLKEPDRLLGTTLVGTNLCGVAASVLATALAVRWLGAWGQPVSGLIMTVTVLVFCEFAPKSWFRAHPSQTLRFATLLHRMGQLLKPLSLAVTSIARVISPLPGAGGSTAQPALTREDLLFLTRESAGAGALSPREHEMIRRVFELDRKTAAMLMTPRKAMVAVRADARVGDVLNIARQHGYSRFPVLQDEGDRIVGIAHVLDLLLEGAAPDDTIRSVMRPPSFVAADLPADELIPRMRLSRQALALVVDDATKVLGLVTSNDVLAEIVDDRPPGHQKA